MPGSLLLREPETVLLCGRREPWPGRTYGFQAGLGGRQSCPQRTDGS